MSVGSQLVIQGGSMVKSCGVCVQSLWVAEVGSQIRVCALLEHRLRPLVRRRSFRNCQNHQSACSHHLLVGKGRHVQGLQRRQRPCHRMTSHCWWVNVKGTDVLRLRRITSAQVGGAKARGGRVAAQSFACSAITRVCAVVDATFAARVSTSFRPSLLLAALPLHPEGGEGQSVKLWLQAAHLLHCSNP